MKGKKANIDTWIIDAWYDTTLEEEEESDGDDGDDNEDDDKEEKKNLKCD